MEIHRDIEVAPVMTELYAKFVRMRQKYPLPTNVEALFDAAIRVFESGAERFDVEDEVLGFTLQELIRSSLSTFWSWATDLTDPGDINTGPLGDYRALHDAYTNTFKVSAEDIPEVFENFIPLHEILVAMGNKYFFPGDIQFYFDKIIRSLENGVDSFVTADEDSGHSLAHLLELFLNHFWLWGSNPKNNLDRNQVLKDWQAIRETYLSF
jgi:hypothetical protein